MKSPYSDRELATLQAYRRSVVELNSRNLPHPVDTSPQAFQTRSLRRIETLRNFLDFLGNPQRGFRIVHVTGTSGKGSTSALIAEGLAQAGFRTGLHTSPYLQAVTEKFSIDGQLLNANTFADLVAELTEQEVEWMRSTGQPRLSYGELTLAIAVSAFARAEVEYAVIEVGAGGRFDLTNLVEPVLSVITSVGLDHLATLGPTIKDVAWHKAGIIKSGVPVIVGQLEAEPMAVAEQEARSLNAEIIRASGGSRSFQDRNLELANLSLQTLGLSPSRALSAVLPGRAELMQTNPRVLIDGAHNGQKMEALVESLPQLLPGPETGRLTVVFASLADKSASEMLHLLAPLTSAFVFTKPDIDGKQFLDPTDLASRLWEIDDSATVTLVADPLKAIEVAIANCRPDSPDAVLVSGSLYLAGAVRERWYATDEIVLQQTSWPEIQTAPE